MMELFISKRKRALGYLDTDKAIRMHVWEEDKLEWCDMQRNTVPDDSSGTDIHPRTKFLTESGVY